METSFDIAVVGGGASGLACAVAAAEQGRACGARPVVALLDAADRVGKPILRTGNGRCNFSNDFIDPSQYHNAAFVKQALTALASTAAQETHPAPACPDGAAVWEFMEGLGLAWVSDGAGRRYPAANKASVVVDVLRAAAAHAGVSEQCSCPVASIEAPRKPQGPFTMRTPDDVLLRARSVVVAVGGGAIGSLDVAGMLQQPTRPVLGPLALSPESCRLTRELDNIRVRCTVSLLRGSDNASATLATQSGELLFRTYGVSGICVYDLSRHAQPGDALVIDLLQAGGPDQAVALLQQRRINLSKRYEHLSFEHMLRGLVLPRVASALLRQAGIDPSAPCDDGDVQTLAGLLGACTLEVEGMGPADQCQVRRGGLDVSGFDPATLQAHTVPGLFACGEALDVDGPCGGYNLHWAWGSGLLAGTSAARRLWGTA